MTNSGKNTIFRKYVREHIVFVLAFLMGILLLTIGILAAVYRLPQRFIDYKFEETLILAPDSPIYPKWVNPVVPIYMRYYIFNVTNGDEIMKGGKPRVKECGPYTYRMLTPKYNVTFHPNDTVSYRNNHILLFEPEMSGGTENDVLFHLNIPLASIGAMMKNIPSIFHYFDITNKVIEMTGGNNLFLNHTAYEIIFGYKDPIFTSISNVMSLFGTNFDPVFGFFYKFNNSDDGLYLVHTGAQDFNQMNKIDRWNGMKLLPYWRTDFANMINGTDGSFFGPNVNSNEVRYIYFPQMCRSLKLEYENDTSVQEISTLKFHFSNDLLENATVHPDNAGFCVPEDNCYGSGVLNVKSCMEDADAIVSLPHFYNADDSYIDAIIGLEPNKEKHDSYFHVEPRSGAVLLGDRKLQINFLLQPSKHVEQVKNVRKMIFPILWLGGRAEVDGETASQLRYVMGLISFMDKAAYLIICPGIFILLLTALCFWREKSNITLKFTRYSMGKIVGKTNKLNKNTEK